jgi:hypothetical protein
MKMSRYRCFLEKQKGHELLKITALLKFALRANLENSTRNAIVGVAKQDTAPQQGAAWPERESAQPRKARFSPAAGAPAAGENAP